MASPSHPSRDCSQVIDHSHVPEFEVAPWIKITLILVYLVIFAVGILGNSVTIRVTQVLQKKGYLQKEVTDHMVSLACSDILVFLIGMPMEFYSIIWNPLTTPSYTVSCKVHTFLFEACSYATLLHVLTLSFERYIAICHPFRYKAMSGPCQVRLLIGFVWVTSALVALPLLFAMGVEYPLGETSSLRRKTRSQRGTLPSGSQRAYPDFLMPSRQCAAGRGLCILSVKGWGVGWGQAEGLTQYGGVSRSRKLCGRTPDIRLYLAMSSRICRCAGFATKKVCAAAAAKSSFFS